MNETNSINKPRPEAPSLELMLRPAARHFRLFAFILDVLLITFLTITILAVFIIPRKYSQEFHELQVFIQNQQAPASKNSQANVVTETPKTISTGAQDLVNFMQSFIMIAFWTFFALSEILTKGSSLGKKVFSLRVISLRTGQAPSIFDSIFRAGTKTLTLLLFFPILLTSYVIYFFTKNHRAGHDFLSKSLVVEKL